MHHTGRVMMGTTWASALSPDTHKKPHVIDHAPGLRGQAPKFPGHCVWHSPLPSVTISDSPLCNTLSRFKSVTPLSQIWLIGLNTH
jgi:hypothetical protein